MDQQLQDLFRRIHLYFLEARDTHTQCRVFSQLQIVLQGLLACSRRVDQVSNVLVVDLQERHRNLVDSVHFEIVKNFENFFHGLVHDTWRFFVAQHRVRLACAGGSIGKDRRVKAIKNRLDQGLGRQVEDF